jgi:hypothetical protein
VGLCAVEFRIWLRVIGPEASNMIILLRVYDEFLYTSQCIKPFYSMCWPVYLRRDFIEKKSRVEVDAEDRAAIMPYSIFSELRQLIPPILYL